MRILHTVASLDPRTGGPARSVPGLVQALRAAGGEVDLWSWDREGASASGLSRVLAAGDRYDIIHDHGIWLSVNHQVANAARKLKIPRIVSPRGMLEPWALRHKRWKKKLAWWAYQKADLMDVAALHATAPQEAQQFGRLGLKVPTHVMPNGVELPDSMESEPDNIRWSDRRTALYLGRIQSKKGLPLLIDAWTKVKPPGWRMRVVGPDEDNHREELQRLVNQAGLSSDWSFENAVDDDLKASVYGSADLFILPTYSENFGIVVAEALAARLPVITTTGAPWEGLLENQCGWWVAPTAASLADALEEACSLDAERLARMGAKGRSWVKDEFGWDKIGVNMMEVYQSIIGTK